MTVSSASLKLAMAVAAAALAVGLAPHGGSPGAPAARVVARHGLDATSDAEARRLRLATRRLAGELAEGARCTSSKTFVRCASPALRHAGIGGRTTAMLARGVLSAVPAGSCREYLFGLQAANDAASDQARWLYPLLFGPGRGRHTRDIAIGIARAARMLRRAWRAAALDVCAPGAAGPAA